MRHHVPTQGLVRGLTFSALILLAAQMTFAQEAKPAAKIAVVDIVSINAQFAQLAVKRDEIQQWYQQQQKYLEELQNSYLYLSEGPFGEILDILRMPRPLSAKAAKRQKELRDLNSQKEDRYLELEAKTDRTAQEQEEFNGLQELRDARLKQITAIAEDLRRQFAEKRKQAEDALNQSLQAAVKDIAAERKYDLVLNKMGVLYGGDDITAAVLERLNTQAGTPAAAGGAAAPAATPAAGGTAAPTAAPAPTPPAPAPAPPAPAPTPPAEGGK